MRQYFPGKNNSIVSSCNSFKDYIKRTSPVTLRVDGLPIQATTRKLTTSFSLEAVTELNAQHGLDLESKSNN